MELFIVVVAGFLLGSFATMLCYRIPREIPLGLFVERRSKCPECQKIVPWFLNIPVFAYLFLKGKCRFCKVEIPLRYFLIEISMVTFFVITHFALQYSQTIYLESWMEWLDKIIVYYFVFSLIVVTFIDLEFRIIPDRFSLGNWILGLASSFVLGDFFFSFLGSVFGALSFFLLAYFYEKVKKVEGLGMGDVKMMGWLGAWVGLAVVPILILIASLSGLLVGLWSMRKSGLGFKTSIPFGPFLAFAAYICWVLKITGAIVQFQ